MQESISSLPPITWVDVARRLSCEQVPPEGVLETEAFWSGLTVTLATDEARQPALDWLDGLFPHRLNRDDNELKLDAPPGLDRLQIQFEIDAASERRSRLFRPSAALQGKHVFDVTMPQRDPDALPLFAFHSVKGGVGRTTAAITLARHLTRLLKKPVLLVDADFEAPGLSYLFSSRKPEISISFEDMLVLAHADPQDDLAGTIAFVAARLAEQRVDDLVVMPVKRSTAALGAFAIRPEHIVSARKGRPFLIADMLRQIAAKSGCGAIVVDLRAGLVEIAMQVLSDPSVERGFVTTTSGQSLDATCDMLRALGEVQQATNSIGRKPVMIINQIPAFLMGDRRFLDDVTKKIEGAAVQSFKATAQQAQNEKADDDSSEVEYGVDSPLMFVEMSHYGDLIRTSNDWEEFLLQLDSTGFAGALISKFRHWTALDSLVRTPLASENSVAIAVDERLTACKTLAKFAQATIFSETAPEEVSTPLVTPPLRRLAEDFLRRPPIAVIEGAKGTGKTLMASFLLKKGTWKDAVQTMDPALIPDITGPIIPVYCSSSQSQKMIDLIGERASEWAKKFGDFDPLPLSGIKECIQRNLSKDLSEHEWTNFWLDAIAWVSSLFPGQQGAWSALLSHPHELRDQPIALFEGLEEVLFDPYTDQKQAVALRALLTGVPLRLREQPGHPVGLMVFVRGDMVEAVIPQNVAQFRANYRNYALTWSTTDILELVAWMADRSGAVPGMWTSKWREEDGKADLERIWGWKLGSERSREARSTEWVLAVLTDLNGRLTARDLVRFISEAARLSVNESVPQNDRILAPVAMRRAVATTSEEKVREYPSEVTVLKDVFGKLKMRRDLEIPLDIRSAMAAGLSEKDLLNLVKYGVFFEEDGSYEVPELFRIGLGLIRKGARPNIISLTRRALEKAKSAN